MKDNGFIWFVLVLALLYIISPRGLADCRQRCYPSCDSQATGVHY